MSDPNPSPEPSLEETIDSVLNRLDELEPDSKEFAAATDQLVKLHKLKQEDEKINIEWSTAAAKSALDQRQQTHQEIIDLKPKPISRDTLVLAGANLLGIVLIVGHERAHVVTSKAIGFIKTLR